MAPSPVVHLQLQNRFGALVAGKQQNVIPEEASELSKHKAHTIDRRKWQGIALVGFRLWRTEAPICLLGSPSRTICCLPGAQIQDVAEKSLKLSAITPGCLSARAQLILPGKTKGVSSDYLDLRWGSGTTDRPALLFPWWKLWNKAPWGTFLGP